MCISRIEKRVEEQVYHYLSYRDVSKAVDPIKKVEFGEKMKKATVKIEMYRVFPDEMSDDEITTTAYLVTCGIIEPYINARTANIVDVSVEKVEEPDETTTD